MSFFTFLKEMVRANKTTGAIAPSSKALAEAITDLANLKDANVIVEFGPGTGVFTEVIERKKKPTSFFMAIEVNPSFVEATKKRCPDVYVVHDSAENTLKYLKEAGYDYCDIIISGLPWTRFEDNLQDRLLNATFESLREGGKFLTFAYCFSPLVPSGKRFFKGKLPKKFNNKCSRSPVILKNFPPCHVYICEK
ncbi:MAG: hypothetical protein N3G21_02950 [Candidatus Hydrogenedentes bacterium]|nr:hypothetical protein [Candidatus Hydrogenedentota bacterium]